MEPSQHHPDQARRGRRSDPTQRRLPPQYLRHRRHPYFRPPYGAHTADTDRIAADLGYTTITLWSGTVGDSRPVDERQLVAFAEQSFQPQQIILSHANLPPVMHTYPQLLDIINSRGLQTVTLNDVFS